MPVDPQLDRARRQRLRYAERKLKEAQQRLARTERSIVYWSRIVADLNRGRYPSAAWNATAAERQNRC